MSGSFEEYLAHGLTDEQRARILGVPVVEEELPYIMRVPAPASDEDLIPRIVGHPDNEPVSPETVLGAYANLVQGINKLNERADPEDRMHVPFGVQEALVRYIESVEGVQGEAEAIESIETAIRKQTP